MFFMKHINIYRNVNINGSIPLISLSPYVKGAYEIMKILIDYNQSFGFYDFDASFKVMDKIDENEGYDLISIEDSPLAIIKDHFFYNSGVYTPKWSAFSAVLGLIFLVIFLFLYIAFVNRDIRNITLISVNEAKSFIEKLLGVYSPMIDLFNFSTEDFCEFSTEVKRDKSNIWVNKIFSIPYKGKTLVFEGLLCSFDRNDLFVNISVSDKKGNILPSSVSFTSYRYFRPVSAEFLCRDNTQVKCLIPVSCLGSFITYDNMTSSLYSVCYSFQETLRMNTILNVNISSILERFSKDLGLSRTIIFSDDKSDIYSYHSPNLKPIPNETILKLPEKYSFEKQCIYNLLTDSYSCILLKTELKGMTVYCVLEMNGVVNDSKPNYFVFQFLSFLITFMYQVARTKEQNDRFNRLLNLIKNSSVFSVFEVCKEKMSLNLCNCRVFKETSSLDDLLDYVTSLNSHELTSAFHGMIESIKNCKGLLKKELKYVGEDEKSFSVSMVPTVDKVSGDTLCTILFEDISPLKKQESELNNSIKDLTNAVNALGLCRFSLRDGEIFDITGDLLKSLKYDDQAISINRIIHPSDRRYLPYLGEKMITIRLLDATNMYVWHSVFASTKSNIGFIFNVDRAVKTREKIKITGTGFQLASFGSSLAFWKVNIQDDSVHPLMEQPTIWDMLSVGSKVKFTRFFDYVEPEKQSEVYDAFNEVKSGKSPYWTGEMKLKNSSHYEYHRVTFAYSSKTYSIQCLAVNVHKMMESQLNLAYASKIRDLMFSAAKMTVWKYFDDDLPVEGQRKLEPGIPNILRINRTFVRECMNEKLAAQFMEKINSVLAGESSSFGFRYNDDGRFYGIEGRFQNQVVGIVIDVTEIELKTKELEQQSAIVKKADRTKAAFLANMSHEIRTPLNGIFPVLDLMAQSDITSEQRLLIDTMRASSFQLLKLLDDTLSFKKIGQGKLENNPIIFDFWTTVEPSIVSTASRARSNCVDFIVDTGHNLPSKLFCDPQLLVQIINNLLSNSLKFTKQGFIRIFFSFDEITNLLTIVVSDTGVGMSIEQQKVIFERFTQGDPSVPKTYGGTGLGLSLVQHIVTSLGGDIALESVAGRGSTFRVEFPAECAYVAYTPPFLNNTIHKIIIISKDIKLQDTIRSCCLSHHYEVFCVPSTNDALEFLKEDTADGIIIGEAEDSVKELMDKKLNIPVCSVGLVEQSSAADHRIVKPVMPHQVYSFLNQCRYGRKSRIEKPQVVEHKRYRVLVVEDNKTNRFVMSQILTNIGCNYVMAENGLEAIEKLENDKEGFDLIFMDCQMPVLDGLEATKRIRESGKCYSDIRIIALTASVVEGDLEKCLNAGMNEYMSKPVRLQQVKNAILADQI